jgi:hypothetical protein
MRMRSCPRGREYVRADATLRPRGRTLFYPCNFKKDATVRLSHGRPRGHRPIVRPSVRPSENVRVTTMGLTLGQGADNPFFFEFFFFYPPLFVQVVNSCWLAPTHARPNQTLPKNFKHP